MPSEVRSLAELCLRCLLIECDGASLWKRGWYWNNFPRGSSMSPFSQNFNESRSWIGVVRDLSPLNEKKNHVKLSFFSTCVKKFLETFFWGDCMNARLYCAALFSICWIFTRAVWFQFLSSSTFNYSFTAYSDRHQRTPTEPQWGRNTPEPFELHIVHQEISGLHQLVDLLQQLFFLLPVLVGLVIICSTGQLRICCLFGKRDDY